MLALNDEIATGSNDSTLADSVRVLGLVSRMKEEASEQGAILTSALNNDLTTQGDFGPDKLQAMQDAIAEQNSNQAEFLIAAIDRAEAAVPDRDVEHAGQPGPGAAGRRDLAGAAAASRTRPSLVPRPR